MRIGTVEISPSWPWPPWRGSRTSPSARSAQNWAGYTITELISSKALCYHDKRPCPCSSSFPGEHPAAVQIFGNDPVCMAEAAQIAIEAPVPTCWTSTWAAPWGKSSITAMAPP